MIRFPYGISNFHAIRTEGYLYLDRTAISPCWRKRVCNIAGKLYLLIDEYDNFANEVLVRDPHNSRRYQDLLEGEGILKSLFEIIKGSAAVGKIRRVFIP